MKIMKSKNIIIISLFVALLAESFLIYIIYFNPRMMTPVIDPSIHPWINASFNFLSALSLFMAYIFINRKKIKLHIIFIHTALSFSSLFLVSYIFYHLSVGHVYFTNESYRSIYLLILISHLIISVISLPLIFVSYALAISKKINEHKKIAKLTFFLWEYVSITGVIIVLMLKFLNN